MTNHLGRAVIAVTASAFVLAPLAPAVAQEAGEIRGQVTLPDSRPAAAGATVEIVGSTQ
jgi:hypothetical protein